MFTSTHQLTAKQLQDLEELRLSCLNKDGNVPNLYPHILCQMRALPSAILCYKDNQLIGFLSAFFFYEDAVEISLLVAPNYRRQGIARQLMKLIKPLIETYNFPNLVFSSPTGLHNLWFSHLKSKYLHSEYHMKREQLNPLLDYEAKQNIRLMRETDIGALIHIDELCFGKKQGDAEERFNLLMHDREYQVFVITQNEAPIAKAHLRWEAMGATLSDIAVLPDFQGKGLATSLIAHCTNIALSEGKPRISLDVETKNERALHLYTRLGFVTKNACDYWKIGINQLPIKPLDRL